MWLSRIHPAKKEHGMEDMRIGCRFHELTSDHLGRDECSGVRVRNPHHQCGELLMSRLLQ